VLKLLRTTPWRRMREWRYSSTILDLDTRWMWVVSFTPRSFCPEDRPSGTQWISGWAGPTAGLDVVTKRNFFSVWNRTLPFEPVVRRYTNWHTVWIMINLGEMNCLNWQLWCQTRSADVTCRLQLCKQTPCLLLLARLLSGTHVWLPTQLKQTAKCRP
jgi:hypothetical protein